jgi:hypothetical protein
MWSTMGVRNFNLRRSQFRNKGKIGSNQSFIDTPLCPIPTQFVFTSVQLSSQKIILRQKNIGGAFAPLIPPQVTHIVMGTEHSVLTKLKEAKNTYFS